MTTETTYDLDGLSVRAANCLNNVSIHNRKEARAALKAATLDWRRGRPRNFGKKSYAEVCKWAGFPLQNTKNETIKEVATLCCVLESDATNDTFTGERVAEMFNQILSGRTMRCEVLPKAPHGSSGSSQSRPDSARPVKVIASAGALTQPNVVAGDGKRAEKHKSA